MKTINGKTGSGWARWAGGLGLAAALVQHAALGAQLPVGLGAAGNYAVLSKSGISTVPASAIVGDIGVSPIDSTAMTGFSLILDGSGLFSRSSQVIGKAYASDYLAPTPINLTTAIANMETAYTDAAGRTLPDATELGSGNIGGLTLAPGLYKWGTGVTIPTDVTLAGGPNDVWIFQIAGDVTMAAGKVVILSGGAQAKNIFWQVAGGAGVEIGTTAHFEGVVLTQKAIHLRTGASINGRLLAQTAVTLDASSITQPTLGRIKVKNDFDGDGRTDIGSYLAHVGYWNIARSTLGAFFKQFGYGGTIPVTADYDGDGKADLGLYDPSNANWYFFTALGVASATNFGDINSVPVSGDFDGDGKSGFGTYSAPGGFWKLSDTTTGTVARQFGYGGTLPVIGDYDGDGRADLALYHPVSGTWYFSQTTDGNKTAQFGYAGTLPIVGDFDGDGKDDFGVYDPRNGRWYTYRSALGFLQRTFGVNGATPVVGDYDGDGRSDIALFNRNTARWYIARSSAGFFQATYGYAGALPIK